MNERLLFLPVGQSRASPAGRSLFKHAPVIKGFHVLGMRTAFAVNNKNALSGCPERASEEDLSFNF